MAGCFRWIFLVLIPLGLATLYGAWASGSLYSLDSPIPEKRETKPPLKNMTVSPSLIPVPIVMQKTNVLAELQEAIQKLQEENQRLEARWKSTIKPLITEQGPQDRLNNLLTILNYHGLRVIDLAPMEGEKEFPLSPAQKTLFQNLGTHRLQLWKLQFNGKQNELLQAFHQLGSEEVLAVLLGISMKESTSNSSIKEWTLFVGI